MVCSGSKMHLKPVWFQSIPRNSASQELINTDVWKQHFEVILKIHFWLQPVVICSLFMTFVVLTSLWMRTLQIWINKCWFDGSITFFRSDDVVSVPELSWKLLLRLYFKSCCLWLCVGGGRSRRGLRLSRWSLLRGLRRETRNNDPRPWEADDRGCGTALWRQKNEKERKNLDKPADVYSADWLEAGDECDWKWSQRGRRKVAKKCRFSSDRTE